MSNGQPGVSQQFGGTGFAASEYEIFNKAGLEGAMGMTPMGADGLVYLGPDYDLPAETRTMMVPGGGVSREITRTIPGRQVMVPVDQLDTVYFQFDEQQKRDWAALSEEITGYPQTPQNQLALWRTTGQYSAAYQKATGQGITIWDLARDQAARAKENREKTGAYKGPVTTVSRSRDVDLTNPSGARAFLDSALGDYLGRLPTEDEYKNFTRALNMAERAAPTITEAETTVTPQGDARRTQIGESERRGGFTPAQFAREFARGQEGAAETAVGGPLLNAFLGLLRGGVR